MYLIFENFRKYLKEAAITNVDKYALCLITPRDDKRIIILYEWEKILINYRKTKQIDSGEQRITAALMEIGTSAFIDDERPCYGTKNNPSWQVKASVATSGLGPMLYDLGLIIAARNGLAGIMPDRKKVSKDAEKIWVQYYERAQGATGIKVQKRKLDYVPPDNETPEKNDDCKMHSGRHVALNYIYSSVAKNSTVFLKMIENHKIVFDELKKMKFSLNKEEFETMLWEDGESFFRNSF